VSLLKRLFHIKPQDRPENIGVLPQTRVCY